MWSDHSAPGVSSCLWEKAGGGASLLTSGRTGGWKGEGQLLLVGRMLQLKMFALQCLLNFVFLFDSV